MRLSTLANLRNLLKDASVVVLTLLSLRRFLIFFQEKGSLPEKYLPHKLQGKYKGCWECHITPDWLMIWKQFDKELQLILVDTGTHSDLF